MGPKLTEASAWYVIAAFNAVRQIDLERILMKHKMTSNHVNGSNYAFLPVKEGIELQ